MARGNQRDKAREKTQKEAASQKKKNTVWFPTPVDLMHASSFPLLPPDRAITHG